MGIQDTSTKDYLCDADIFADAVPVKSIVYDALQYAHQVEELKVNHRNAGDKGSSAEFLSGMHRDDHLVPVITICIYFGYVKIMIM